ncbi:hypothetical protein [Martelella alba]|uniref:Uncharacterized protein n=1 Tax=Martelella alba TaxID=2590451 RepID=A0ABY2SEM5_9HYPH|nr:hypothetical protein [Martelella alba]TKI02413.1 hypothetical protein FCN80_25125 [Martelella alba]
MFKFDMQIAQNYAAFYNPEDGKCVFVDSFDNQEFDVRVGTLTESRHVGTVHAKSDDELNRKLRTVTAAHL